MSTIRIVLLSMFLFSWSYSNVYAQKGNTINYDSIKLELERIYDADQDIRRILIDSIGLDSPEAGKYLSKMNGIDRRNKAKIEAMLEKYGWIKKSKIGEKASEAIFYTVQHTDLEFLEKYFPQFKKLAEIGEASPIQCAMMEDRLLMWKGKKQIYGTQSSDRLRSDKKYVVWPIENSAGVNELRKKVGFKTTVEEDAKRLNAEYDPNGRLPEKKN
jgi:hypothetical protein